MTPDQLADIGLARLRLPTPMSKLQIIHEIANALHEDKRCAVTWQALLRYIKSLELESEVLEALCIVLKAKGSNILSLSNLRQAIQSPSILSDYFISQAFDVPILVNSWDRSHSGEAPPFFQSNKIEKEFNKGHIAPPILSSKLSALEKRSGKPFLKQWAFEFDRLLAKNTYQSDGHFSYFSDSHDRQSSTGFLIGRRSQLARSAYLRVFAFAVDMWDMPQDLALNQAMNASPTDICFLQMLPSNPPNWASKVHQMSPRHEEDWNNAVQKIPLLLEEYESDQFLMHFDGPLFSNDKYQAQLEIISILSDGADVDPQDAFRMHDLLLGRFLFHVMTKIVSRYLSGTQIMVFQVALVLIYIQLLCLQ